MSPPSIVTLPLELLVEILKGAEDFPTLLSLVLSNKWLYTAYLVAKRPIRKAVWYNYLGDNLGFCAFLTNAIQKFPRHGTCESKPLLFSEVVDFVQQYIRFAHPSTQIHPDDIKIPEVSQKDLARTHKWMIVWAKKFCSVRLAYNPITKKPMEYKPPTCSELRRITRSLYQFWLFMHFYQRRFHDKEGKLVDKEGMPRNITLALVHSLPYRDFVFVYNSIIPFFQELIEPVMENLTSVQVYREVRRKDPDWRYNYEYPGLRPFPTLLINNTLCPMFLVSHFGPERLWSFLFKSNYNRQQDLCNNISPQGTYSWLMETFKNGKDDDDYRDSYDPVLRICRKKVTLMPCDYQWWDFWDDGEDSKVDKRAIMWDDWRLKELGYRFPDLCMHTAFPGLVLSTADEIQIPKGPWWFIEHSRRTYWRDRAFPEMREGTELTELE